MLRKIISENNEQMPLALVDESMEELKNLIQRYFEYDGIYIYI